MKVATTSIVVTNPVRVSSPGPSWPGGSGRSEWQGSEIKVAHAITHPS
jgi:hypothetical protein